MRGILSGTFLSALRPMITAVILFAIAPNSLFANDRSTETRKAHHVERNEVYVIGTLYKRHEQVPAFNVAVLKRVITDIKPDVMVLDVTPTELQQKNVFPGKIEYIQAVFPLLENASYITYAAEPAEPLFSEIVQAVSQAHKSFPKDKPVQAAALEQHEKATYELLKQHWSSVANVQDEVTAAALRATIELSGAMMGPVVQNADIRWDRHTADVVLKAAAEHPGKRIMVLTGIRNRPLVTENLRADASIQLIDMPAWLRQHGYGG
jgi:hypothetical protein